MSIRAKFKVEAIQRSMTSMPVVNQDGTTEWKPTELRTIALSPVYSNGDPNHENSKFWHASPSGEIKLGVVNLAAAEAFELGQEYYIDFTPAE